MRTQPKPEAVVSVEDLEVGIGSGGVITLTANSLIGRHVAEGMADLKAGRVHGPYRSAEKAVAALSKKAAAPRNSKR